MKFPYYKAIVVAETILDLVHDSCTRIVIAGSIRRQNTRLPMEPLRPRLHPTPRRPAPPVFHFVSLPFVPPWDRR